MGAREDIQTELVSAGQVFELETVSVHGNPLRVFKNAPRTLGEVWLTAAKRGDIPYLIFDDVVTTFTEADKQVRSLAAWLQAQGIQPGDRVAVGMRNYPEWVIAYWATQCIGAVLVSLNAWWVTDELKYALSDSGARAVVVDGERQDRLSNEVLKDLGIHIAVVARGEVRQGWAMWHEVSANAKPDIRDVNMDTDDIATILYTSGTTGRPKGAVSTHRAILSSIMAFSARNTIFQMSGTKLKDVDGPEVPTSFILIVPLFHVTGCVPVMLSCFVAGLKLAIMYKWDPEKALEMIEREQITNFVGVPTQSWDLVNSPAFEKYDTSSLRAVGGGGAPSPTSLVGKVNDKVKNGNPQLGYGMTETNAFGPAITGSDYLSHPTSTGRASWPMFVEVRDENLKPVPTGQSGEIWFFGPMLIRGYWNRPDATAETIVDGWLRSGDLGRLDADGYVYVEDRVKDMILRAGENVYGAEVESAIYEHPAVHEAAVFGVPHERLGEEVGVAILVNDGMTLTPEELWTFLDVKIAKFKIPTQVVIMSEPLPRNAAGKFLKRELQQHVVKGTLKATSR